MNPGPGFAIAAALALLGACSPAPRQPAAEKGPQPTAAAVAVADQGDEKLPPVLDSEGNELDPELADAVREKMASDTPEENPVVGPADDGA